MFRMDVNAITGELYSSKINSFGKAARILLPRELRGQTVVLTDAHGRQRFSLHIKLLL